MLERPLSARVCDAFLVGFATWTLLCNAVVFAGGSLRILVWSAAALATATLIMSRLRRPGLVCPPAGRGTAEVASEERVAPARLAIAAAGALIVCVVAAHSRSIVTPWWAALLLLAAALGAELLKPDPPAAPARADRNWEATLWALALACAAIPLCAHYANRDDAFYVNLAVAPGDQPDQPLLAADTLHGIPDLPLLMPVYRLHSVELLAAALAWITPLDGIEVCHLLLPAVFALLAPLALARLARRLAPGQWLWVVLAVLAVLVLAGGPKHWHSNFGFVRLHQGKSVFVTVMVPLLLFHALDFARRPGMRSWLLLVAVQLAALGFTATALWAAPVIVGLGLIAGVTRSRRGLVTLLAGVLGSAYLVAAGLAVRAQAADSLEAWNASFEGRGAAWPPDPGDPDFLQRTWREVMGGGAWSLLLLFSILAAWGSCASAAGRRLALVLGLGFLLLFNPYFAGFVAEHVTGGVTFFRVFWVLPVPLLLGLVLSSPAGWDWLGIPLAARLAGAAGVGLMLLLALPERRVLSAENEVRFAPFALNVPPAEYEAARRLVAAVPARSHVLAPPDVSLWVGTFPQHPFAVVPRSMYLRYLEPHLGADEVERRRALADPQSVSEPDLDQALERYDLSGVCIPSHASATRRMLKRAGLQPAWRGADYEVWVRS